MSEERELNLTYWRGVVVPVVFSMLIIASVGVFLSANVGQPHPLVAKPLFGGFSPKAFRGMR